MKKKVLSMILSAALCLSLMPEPIFTQAAGNLSVSGSDVTGTAAGNEAAGSSAGNEAAGSSAGNEAAGSSAGNEAAGSSAGNEAAGSSAGNEAAGSSAGNEAAGSSTGSSAGNEAAGSSAGNEAAGSSTGSGLTQGEGLAAVQSLIDALPSLEELQAAEAQRQQEIYEALQEAYDAYEALSEEEQTLLTGADCFETLFGWFNAQISPLEGEETHTHCICGSEHHEIGDHKTDESTQIWTAITDADGNGTITKTELHTQIENGGYFYLTADVVQEDGEEKLEVTYEGVTAICLNGHEMNMKDSWYQEGIWLSKKGNEETKLILTDCDVDGKGAITFTQKESYHSMYGVQVQNGASFEMYGGTIKGMKYSSGGAGVRCTGYLSSFKLYGGSIQGNYNTRTSPIECGAAVYCDGTEASFTMYGGKITGNTHENGSGGGVYCAEGATFTMLGGEITGNTAALNGGGVILDGSMTIGGTAKITGNTAGEKTGNLYLNGSESVLNVRSDFTGEVGLAALDGEGRQIVKRETGSTGKVTYDAAGYALEEDGTLKLDHTHAPGEETADRCAICNAILVASVTSKTGEASYYTKLQDAMDAVTAGATVKLLNSADYAGDLKITQPMMLDLNGKSFYTVAGNVFILAENVKIQGNASGGSGGYLTSKIWDDVYNYYNTSTSAAVTIGSTGEGAADGRLTLSDQATVGEVTVLNGTFTMTEGTIYGLVSNQKGDALLSGGMISKYGSGITINGTGYTIKDLLAEDRVLNAVTEYTSTAVSEELLNGTRLTTEGKTTSYKIVKPGFASVSITGGDITVRYGETVKVTLTAVPVMAEGYEGKSVTYIWSIDDRLVDGGTAQTYEFDVSHFGSKAPAEGETETESYVITCTMTCEGYEQTAETKITVLPKDIAASESNVTLGSGSETFTYTGSALTPAVTLKDGNNTVDPEEYELTYSNNLNAGTATVTFTDNPGGNYKVTGSVSFTIEKAANTGMVDTDTKVTMVDPYDYGGTLPTPQLTGRHEGGTVTYYYNTAADTTGGSPWSELTSTTLAAGDTPYYLYAEIRWENYETFTTPTTSFKVNKVKAPVTTWPTVKDVYVGDTLDTQYLEGGDSPVPGSFAVSGTPASWNAAGSYETELTYTATGADKDNYLPNTQKATVTVIKRTLQSVESLTAITGKGYETPQEDLGLPKTVDVLTEDSQKYLSIPVNWSGYDPNSLKKQTLTGTLDISGIETLAQQPEPPVTASIEVTLYMATSTAFPNKTATYTGNPIAYDAGTLPTGVKSVTYEYEGTDGTEYAKSFTAPTNAGKYNIIVRFTMEEGQTQLSPVATKLTIEKAQTPGTYTATVADFAYGSPSAPMLSPIAEDRTVTYYYSASNQTDVALSTRWTEGAETQSVGDYYLFAVIGESENYQAYTTATSQFTISKAEPVVQWPTVSAVYVGDTLDATYLGEAAYEIPGGFTITGDKSWTESGTQTTTLTFTAKSENGNYEATQTQKVSVEVLKRRVTSTNPKSKSILDKEFGTEQGALGLPATVSVIATAHTGTKAYTDIPVSWSGYNPETLEIQTLTGTPDISKYDKELEQPATPITVKATVQLQEKKAAAPTFASKTVTYDGKTQEHELAAAAIPEGVDSVSYSYQGTGSTTYEASATAPTDAGTYTVTASFTMKYGYADLASVTATLTIDKADPPAAVQMSGYAYATDPSAPTITGNAGNAKVTYYYNTTNSNTGGEQWQSMGSYELEAGTYYLYAVGEETANYRAFTTAPVSFTVEKGTPNVSSWPTVSGSPFADVFVGDTLSDSNLSGNGTADVAGSFSITGTKRWDTSGEKQVELTFTPKDTANYKAVTHQVEITVKKRQVWTVKSSLDPISDKDFGTALEELGLPGMVDICTADNVVYKDIPVTWSGYNPNTVYTQFLVGTLDISGYDKELAQPAEPVTARIQVDLKRLIATAPDFSDKAVTYNGQEQKHELAGMPKGVASVLYTYEGTGSTKYSQTTLAPTDAGTYIVRAGFTMQDGYERLDLVTSTLTINKAGFTASAQMGSYSYGSRPALPKVTDNPGNAAVTYYYSKTDSNTGGDEWKDITATTLDVGTYYLYAVIAESDNYQACTTAPVSFKVELGEPPVTWPTVKKVYVGDTLDESYLEDGSSTVDGSFSVTGSPKSWSAGGTETIELTFTPTDTAHYRPVTHQVEITVKKRQVAKVTSVLNAVEDKDFGTAFADFELPAKVSIETADGKKYDNIPVTWNGYNGRTLNAQTLTGTLDISKFSAELEQPGTPITAELQITLQPLKAKQPLQSDFPDKTVTYNRTGQEHKLAADKIPAEVTYVQYEYEGTNGTEYEKTAAVPQNAGTYTVTASFTMEYGYAELAPVTSTLTIEKAELERTAYKQSDTYGQEPYEPLISSSVGIEPDMVATYYYSTENSNQGGTEWKNMTSTTLKPGTYYIYAIVAESKNYKGYRTAAAQFSVAKAEAPVTAWPTVKEIYVGDVLDTSYLEDGSAGIAGSFRVSGTTYWSESGTGTTVISFTPEDTDCYMTVQKRDAEVKIVKRTVAGVKPQTAITELLFGAAFAELELPERVSITTADGEEYDGIPVTWEEAGYDPQTLETQTLTGSLDLTDIAAMVEQPSAVGTQPVTAEIQVTLQPLTTKQPAQSAFPDKTVTYDGSAESLALAAADIPVGVEAVSYSYEGTDGTSYEASGTAPVNAGSYTVTASFTMENGYAPLDALTAKLTIERRDIAGADITLGAALTANGEQQTQTLAAVKLGDLTLTAEDYELSGNTAVEAGEYTLTIRGKGNYSGEATKSWSIAAAEESGESGEGSGSGEGSTGTAPTSYSWPNVNALLQDISRTMQQIGNSIGEAGQENRNINVQLPGENQVPAYVLRTLCGTQLTLAVQQGNGVALSISGEALNEGNLSGVQTLDLTTDTNTAAIPAAAIRDRQTAGSRQLSIRDTGRFAVPVGLHVGMGAENAGRFANFYRYNEAQDRLEYCGSFRITENGQAMLNIRQGGSYFINVTDAMPVEKYLFSADAYTVRSGDTLSKIARRYRMTLAELLQKNPTLRNANRIRVGQKINVN